MHFGAAYTHIELAQPVYSRSFLRLHSEEHIVSCCFVSSVKKAGLAGCPRSPESMLTPPELVAHDEPEYAVMTDDIFKVRVFLNAAFRITHN